MSPLPDQTHPGDQFDLAVDVKNAKAGDSVAFSVAAGPDVVASLKGQVQGATAKARWTVDPGMRGLPLSVAVTASLHGQTLEVGKTTIVPGARVSTLGWLDANGRVIEVDHSVGARVAAAGESVFLKFDIDDGQGGAAKETLAFTFILEHESQPGRFNEVGRFQDSATGVTKFERRFDTPTDASVPGTFRIVLETRVSGETGEPSLGRRTSPPLAVVVFAPLVTRFSGLNNAVKGSQLAERVALGPGQQLRLEWDVLGAFQSAQLVGAADVDLKSATQVKNPDGSSSFSITVDPVKDPPDGEGQYTVFATNGGLDSPGRQIIVVAITEFVLRLADGQPPDVSPRRLTKKDGRTQVAEIRARAKPFADPAHDFEGQVTPSSNVILAWNVAGARNVRVLLDGQVLLPDPKDKSRPPKLLREDVTEGARQHDGVGQFGFHDPSAGAVLDAELRLVEDLNGKPGPLLARAILHVREDFPLPRLAGFVPMDGKEVVSDGATVSSWSNLGYRWVLDGNEKGNSLCRLIVTIKSGTASFKQTFKAQGVAQMFGDSKPTEGGPFDSEVIAEAQLINLLDEVQTTKTVKVKIAPAPRPPQPKPQGEPPKMKVGFNYPWAFNKYGLNFGPGGLIKADGVTPEWVASVPKNLAELKRMGISVVRWFILANCANYGSPVDHSFRSDFFDVESWSFDPPPALDPLFTQHFRTLLEFIRDAGLQLIPSFVDFGIAELHRIDALADPKKRDIFLKAALDPLLDVSKGFRDQIFAWEVMNEPSWCTRSISPPRHRYGNQGGDLTASELTDFLKAALEHIHDAGFRDKSTVGHRFLSDLSDFPTGALRQFHYYARVYSFLGLNFGDPEVIPTAASSNAFVGEFGARAAGDQGEHWTDCAGVDLDENNTVFSRLTVLARKGYSLAMVWPDLGNPGFDDLKLSAAKKASLERFTRGLFENGVP
jgi:hypothetical protein